MFMQVRADHCKKAEDVRTAAIRVSEFRRKLRRSPVTIVEPSRPVEIEVKRPQRDWLVVTNNNKFPPNVIHKIKKLVAKEFGVTIEDIDSAARTKDLLIPRHTAMYLCKIIALKSYPDIGRRFGDRDHTTCLAAFRRTEKRMRAYPWLCQTIVDLEASLRTHFMQPVKPLL